MFIVPRGLRWQPQIGFDAETLLTLELLSRDSGKSFQQLADEAFSDLLAKHKTSPHIHGSQKPASLTRQLLATSEMVILKLPISFVAAAFALGCAKNLDGNTSFKEANKGFAKELSSQKRKQAIESLQAETNATNREPRTTDRTVTPLPSQVVTPVNPPPE